MEQFTNFINIIMHIIDLIKNFFSKINNDFQQ